MTGLLSIGKSAVMTQQRMLATTSNNISNVATDGYTRQRTNAYACEYNYGVGSTINQRLNDVYSQQEVWRDTSTTAFYTTVYDQLSQVDKLLSSSTTGMSSTITEVFGSLQSAVNNPSSTAERAETVGTFRELANKFNTLSSEINRIQNHNSEKMIEDANEINAILKNIATYNDAIVATNDKQASTTLNMYDMRDQLISELSQYLDIRTINGEKGEIFVTLGSGQSVVLENGAYAQFDTDSLDHHSLVSMHFESTFNSTNVNAKGGSFTVSQETLGGEFGGLFKNRNEIDSVLGDLGQLAASLATSLNDQNKCGIDLNGNLGTEIFGFSSDPTQDLTDGSIYLSSSVGSNGGLVKSYMTDSSLLTADKFIFTTESDGAGNVSISVANANDPENPLNVEFVKGADNLYVIKDKTTGEELYGLKFDLQNFDTLPKGISEFVVQPSKDIASNISMNSTFDERYLALAGGYSASANTKNYGDAVATISSIKNLDYIDSSTMNLTKTSPSLIKVEGSGSDTTYAVYDSSNKLIGKVKSSDCKNGENILSHLSSDYGFDISISGTVYAGDSFSIGVNKGATGDNSNGLLMCALQTDKTRVEGNSSFTEAYSTMTSEFGSTVNSANVNQIAAEAKLQQSTETYQSKSSVSLDEEAANLVKFQQYYAAAARIITASQTIFDALISAV